MELIPSRVKELEKSGAWRKLYPILKTKEGEILDGNHRLAADPNWEVKEIDVKDPIEKVKIMMESNLNRRDVSKEEKKEWVDKVEEELKKQGKNYGKDSIAKVLGVNSKTIYNWKGGTMSPPINFDRKVVSHAANTNMYYDSEINYKDSRNDAFHTIKEGEPYPTLKRRSWFYHENGTEFSLREYARVQEFPDDFIFIGKHGKIKDQIGNAVAPPMAEYIAKDIPKGNAIELFAGCGGMALGFENKGHKVIWMNEFHEMACRTYKKNFPNTFINIKDIKDIKVSEIKKEIANEGPHQQIMRSGGINLIFGGPPCQGFSLSGVRFKDDARNFLYREFLRIVKSIKPKYFVMENVMGILPFADNIREDFVKEGYDVEVKVVKGEEIGMRQKRHRVFFIGRIL